MSSKKILMTLIIFLFLPLVIAQNEDFTLDYTEKVDYVCPTSTSLYTFKIINVDSTESQYTITLSGDTAKWATAVPTGFSLSPGSSKTVYTYITPKSDSLPGKYSIEISISSSKGSIKTINHEVNVKDCHQVEVVAEPPKESCPCDLVKYEFVIKNLGEYDTTYNLEIGGSASEFITLSEKVISVKASQSAVVYAYVENLCDIGKHDLTLTARNKAVSSATTELNIKSCFDYTVEADKDYISLCEHSTANFLITITNNGDRINTYFLSAEGPAWANLEKKSLVLNPGEKDSVYMLLSPDYNVAGDFNINFKAVSEKGNILAIKLLKANVRKCHGVIVDIAEEKAKVCNSFSSSLPLLIKNNGEVKEKYSLRLEGPEWSSLEKSFVELNPGEDKYINLNIAPLIDTPIGDYDIKVIAESLDKSIKSEDKIKINNVLREECYKPSILLKEVDVKIGKESTLTIPVTIENKGSEKAIYNLAVSGTASSWVQLNPSIVTVEPGMAETIYLYVAPSEQVNEGKYNIEVSARLKDTEVLDSKNIKINVVKETPSTTIVIEDEVNKTATAITGFFVNLKDKVSDNKYYLLIVIGLLIILIILIKTGAFKKIKDFFKEEEEEPKEEEKEEDKKVEVKEEPELEEWEEESHKKKYWLIGVLALVIIFFGWKWISAYKYYLLLGIGILIVLIILIKTNAFKKLIEFFKEEEEKPEEEEGQVGKEKPEEKKVEVKEEHEVEEWEEEKSNKKKYWLIGILGLAVLIYLGRKYKWFSSILVYKYYIIGAVVALIIIVVCIKTKIFKKIMDFFEEEETEEEPEKEEIEEEKEAPEEEEKEEKVERKKEEEEKKKVKKAGKKEESKKEEKKNDEEMYY